MNNLFDKSIESTNSKFFWANTDWDVLEDFPISATITHVNDFTLPKNLCLVISIFLFKLFPFRDDLRKLVKTIYLKTMK